MGCMRRCLVTGASGFLGGAVVRRLSDAGWEVVGSAYRHGALGLRVADLREPEAVMRLVSEVRPDVVVHCAAGRDPDACERDPAEARRLNVKPVEFLDRALAPDASLLFVSSDYVFAGTRPPYREDDERDPVNVYGQTKKEAEDVVMARAGSAVLRIPVLVGAGPSLEESGFIGKMHRMIRARRRVEVENTIVRFPTWIEDVADAIRFILERRASGIFHYSSGRGRTRYGWTEEMAELLGCPADHVVPVDSDPAQVARRPRDAHLDTARLRGMGFARSNDFADVVAAVLGRFGIRLP